MSSPQPKGPPTHPIPAPAPSAVPKKSNFFSTLEFSESLSTFVRERERKQEIVTNILSTQYQITGLLNAQDTKQEIIQKALDISVRDLILVSEFVRDIQRKISEQLSTANYEASFDNTLDGETLSLKDCQTYFGKEGVFEKVKQFKFLNIKMDVKCLSKLPQAATKLSIIDVELTDTNQKYASN